MKSHTLYLAAISGLYVLLSGCSSTTALNYQQTPVADIPKRFMAGDNLKKDDYISVLSSALTRDRKAYIAGSNIHVSLRAYTPPLLSAWAKRYTTRSSYYKRVPVNKKNEVEQQFIHAYGGSKLCFSVHFLESEPWLTHDHTTWHAVLHTPDGQSYPLKLQKNTLPKMITGSEDDLLACSDKTIPTDTGFKVVLTSQFEYEEPTKLAFEWGISQF